MNNVDKQYLSLLSDIMENGVEKETRAGAVKSVFGRQMRFDLKEGFPLLTTKKVFTKGVIHELLWFLQHPCNSTGSMNIEYLVRNGVHIWDDDAYRWYKEWIDKNIIKPVNMDYEFFVCTYDDEKGGMSNFEYWIEGEKRKEDLEWLINLTKEEFIDLVLQRVEIRTNWKKGILAGERYRFGNLGPIYGTQWRSFSSGILKGKDQIQDIIDTLKTNPNDRRMLCIAFNPSFLKRMALPPCHVMFQFYTRELSSEEQDRYGVKYGLSCMYTMRSNDIGLGWSFNVASYSLLTYMIANLVNMIPDELIASLGDCHIYMNHIDALKEQMKRNGSDIVPKLKINRKVENIDDFKYEDFIIEDYHPDPPIRMPLSVGR